MELGQNRWIKESIDCSLPDMFLNGYCNSWVIIKLKKNNKTRKLKSVGLWNYCFVLKYISSFVLMFPDKENTFYHQNCFYQATTKAQKKNSFPLFGSGKDSPDVQIKAMQHNTSLWPSESCVELIQQQKRGPVCCFLHCREWRPATGGR